jgi:hypothetical protein
LACGLIGCFGCACETRQLQDAFPRVKDFKNAEERALGQLSFRAKRLRLLLVRIERARQLKAELERRSKLLDEGKGAYPPAGKEPALDVERALRRFVVYLRELDLCLRKRENELRKELRKLQLQIEISVPYERGAPS